jgi:hypothetical protein
MKKVCPKCGRNRNLEKKWYDDNHNGGKQSCCKDCQSFRHKQYRQTLRYKILKKANNERYKKKNKDKIKKYNADYYRKNKERIMFNLKSRKLTESILIPENMEEKKINRTRYNRKTTDYNIVIDPKRK